MKPRWLALLALVIAVMVGFGLLGRWQLDVARDDGTVEAATEAASLPVVPLQEVLGPHQQFPTAVLNRVVTATGSYRPADQVLITDRRLGERSGYWVVDALVLDDGGAVLPVLRGFVQDAATASAPPAGRFQVTGALAVGEPSPDQPAAMPSGQLQRLNMATLVNLWPGDLYNAFLFASAEAPATGAAASGGAGDTPVSPGLFRVAPPAPEASGQLAWRNLGYALQWWFFAGFALYMWWRMVREDAHGELATAGATPADATWHPSPTPLPAHSSTPAPPRARQGESTR